MRERGNEKETEIKKRKRKEKRDIKKGDRRKRERWRVCV